MYVCMSGKIDHLLEAATCGCSKMVYVQLNNIIQYVRLTRMYLYV